ncbi:MAG: hypothetical protein QW777_01150 [Candidatus Caldarchaeum sp.]
MKALVLLLSAMVLASWFSLFEAYGLTIQVVDLSWGSPSNPEKAIPGDSNVELSVVVANIGNKPVCSLEAEILPKLNRSLPIASWETGKPLKAFLQTQLNPGTMGSLVFRVNVLEDVRPGRYEADLRLSFRECSSTSDVLPTAQTVSSIVLQVYPPPSMRIVRTAWFVDGVERSVGPGSGPAVLRVYLEAPLETSISNVEMRISPPRGFTGKTFYDAYLERIPAGSVFTLEFPLVVAEEARVGVHSFVAEITYRNKYGTLLRSVRAFDVDVLGREEIVVESAAQSVAKGSYGTLKLLLKNTGSAPAYNVELVLRPEDPRINVLDAKLSVSTLQPGERREVGVNVFTDRSAEASVYMATVILEYRDGYANIRSKEFRIAFNVAEEFRRGFKATASQKYINAGSSSSVELTVLNENPYAVREVRIAVLPETPSITVVEGETRAVLDSMKAGESYVMPLKILATSQAGDSVATITASVEYRDQAGVRVVENLAVSLAVRADIDIKFKGVQLSPSRVRPGETVDVAGDVVNEGSNIARAVAVELNGGPPYEALGESRSVVGLVNPSQVSAFTLNFRVQNNAQPGKYSVVVKASYRNGFGELFEKETVLEYEVVQGNQPPATTVSPAAQQRFDPLLVAVVAAVVLALGGIVLLRRRRKRE